LQANEDRKLVRNLEAEAEAPRAALEERMTANEERRLALEEKKVANDVHQCLMEEEGKLFFMDTSNMDERQKEYINLARDEVLAKKKNVGKTHECTFGRLWRLRRHGSTGRCLWRRHRSIGGCLWRRHGKHGRHRRNEVGWLWRRLWRDKCTDGKRGRHGSTGGCLWSHRTTTVGFVASIESPIPPSSHEANGEEANNGDDNIYEDVER
jgi:hypothetical protein